MSRYVMKETKRFTARLAWVKKKDPTAYRRIMEVIDRLLESPEDADGQMHGPYRGKEKKYVGQGEYRLIYYWSELCRKANRHLNQAREDCHRISDKNIIFFDIYHKAEGGKLNY